MASDDALSTGLTYAEVAATRGVMPGGYKHLERRRVVGQGHEVFERAAEQVMRWEVQRRAGLVVDADAERAAEGVRVTTRLGASRLGVAAPCMVVYTVEEPERRGFAYGTLPGHPEQGEELFLVELHADDSVTLTVRAFSRPALWWTRAAAPATRVVQRRVVTRYLRALEG